MEVGVLVGAAGDSNVLAGVRVACVEPQTKLRLKNCQFNIFFHLG